MMTGTYWPKDGYISNLRCVSWSTGDRTVSRNGATFLEGPSYCVRLLVFDYDECLL